MNIRNVLILLAHSQFIYGEDTIEPVDIVEPPPKPITKPAPKADAPKYTEQQMNDRVGNLRKSLESKLEASSSNVKLTAEERDAARTELENLQTQWKSKEQLAEDQLSKTHKKHAAEIKVEQERSRVAETNYESLLIDVELTREEATVGPSIPGALVDAMRGKTKLVEEVNDEGKKTGKKVVCLEFDDFDKDGKPIKSSYPVGTAFKRMKEIPVKYGIYFAGVGAGGVGGTNGKGGSGDGLPAGTLPKDIDTYAASRNANKKK